MKLKLDFVCSKPSQGYLRAPLPGAASWCAIGNRAGTPRPPTASPLAPAASVEWQPWMT